MERTSIELITGFTKTGKPQYQKYLAKPIITLFETIQGSKLGLKLNKAFKGSDFKELTEEEFNNLSVTEQEEYKNKQEEIEDNMALQMEVLEEVLDFIVEAFDNQFTSIELQKGLPKGQEGIEKIGQLIGRITGGEPSDTKKFVTENQK
ncbi:phage tail assembly chaperone G [Staphylococcus aureus]|uniref:phage tail assembly chaperone G n=1 Tax=Staphylococcus aureus TaxID=1280 RepID=UPI0012B05FCE|nr:hypothetical protein [Staphylococcus aureus]MRV56642.1 hypothetical protein [Staphylococcus aureus]